MSIHFTAEEQGQDINNKNTRTGAPGVAQLARRVTLDFSSGNGLWVVIPTPPTTTTAAPPPRPSSTLNTEFASPFSSAAHSHSLSPSISQK